MIQILAYQVFTMNFMKLQSNSKASFELTEYSPVHREGIGVTEVLQTILPCLSVDFAAFPKV